MTSLKICSVMEPVLRHLPTGTTQVIFQLKLHFQKGTEPAINRCATWPPGSALAAAAGRGRGPPPRAVMVMVAAGTGREGRPDIRRDPGRRAARRQPLLHPLPHAPTPSGSRRTHPDLGGHKCPRFLGARRRPAGPRARLAGEGAPPWDCRRALARSER